MTSEHQEGLIHGMGVEWVVPQWPRITLADAQALLANFPEVGGAEALLWHSPRPFSAAAKVACTHRAVLIKRYDIRVRNLLDLQQEHGFAQALRDQGVPLPIFYADHQGHTAFEQGGWVYEVQHLAQGEDWYQDAQSWTPFLQPSHAFAAGKALGQLHAAARTYTAPERTTRLLVGGAYLLLSDDPIQALADWQRGCPALSSYLSGRDWRTDWQRHIAPFWPALQAVRPRLTPLWTHNDWHASNLLWQEDEQGVQVVSVLDLGLSNRTFALYDVATAIERNCLAWLNSDEGYPVTVDWSGLDQLLRGYKASYGLTHQDCQALAAVLPLVHLEFALSEVDYFMGVVGQRTDADLAYDGYFLGHCQWFSSTDGRQVLRFIEQFCSPCE